MSFFDLELVLKGRPMKSKRIMPCLKLFKKMLLGQKQIEKQTKIAIHMDL
jgi:hypothetical protein